jgi:hypothetical protein
MIGARASFDIRRFGAVPPAATEGLKQCGCVGEAGGGGLNP